MRISLIPLTAMALILAGAGQASAAAKEASGPDSVSASQSGKSEGRLRYEGKTAQALAETGRRIDAIEEKKSALPEYDNLDQAWSAIKQQWDATKAMVGDDWQQARKQFDHDFAALKRQVNKLTAD